VFTHQYVLTLAYAYGYGVCRCAYLVGNVQEYVTVCLELIGKCILCGSKYVILYANKIN